MGCHRLQSNPSITVKHLATCLYTNIYCGVGYGKRDWKWIIYSFISHPETPIMSLKRVGSIGILAKLVLIVRDRFSLRCKQAEQGRVLYFSETTSDFDVLKQSLWNLSQCLLGSSWSILKLTFSNFDYSCPINWTVIMFCIKIILFALHRMQWDIARKGWYR